MHEVEHFFYSAKQAECFRKENAMRIFRNGETKKRINYALIDGKKVQYTECGKHTDHGTMWDDMQYLGEGEYNHSEGYY